MKIILETNQTRNGQHPMATVMFQLEVEGLVATYSLMGLLIAQAGYPTEVGRNKSDIMEGGK